MKALGNPPLSGAFKYTNFGVKILALLNALGAQYAEAATAFLPQY